MWLTQVEFRLYNKLKECYSGFKDLPRGFATQLMEGASEGITMAFDIWYKETIAGFVIAKTKKDAERKYSGPMAKVWKELFDRCQRQF